MSMTKARISRSRPLYLRRGVVFMFKYFVQGIISRQALCRVRLHEGFKTRSTVCATAVINRRYLRPGTPRERSEIKHETNMYSVRI